MTPSPSLLAALEIFTELGWADAELSDVEGLPLGTQAQQLIARHGLRSGEWGRYGQIGPNSYGWISAIDVDEQMLAVYAVRVGVGARRTAQLAGKMYQVPSERLTRLLVGFGPEFARGFIEAVCRSTNRAWEHSASFFGTTALQLRAVHDLPVPENLEYLKDWAQHAGHYSSARVSLSAAASSWVGPDTVHSRFSEHLRACFAIGLPATGPLPSVLWAAVETGRIGRDEALDLVFSALESARRPVDRKIWASLLIEELELSESEVVARSAMLIPVLAAGDVALVEAFAPTLIAQVDDDDFVDLLTVGLSAPTKKSRLLVLREAARRPPPGVGARRTVGPVIEAVLRSSDRTVTTLARKLVELWGLSFDEQGAVSEVVAQDWWRDTPPLWTVPRFKSPAPSQEELTAAAAELSRRSDHVVDVETERFIVLANDLARLSPEATRSALRGLRPSWDPGVGQAYAWMVGEEIRGLDYEYCEGPPFRAAYIGDPPGARVAAVFQRLGQVPVLLSTPSTIDLQVDVGDLLERLQQYRRDGAIASEADLLLAMTRMDPAAATPAHRREFRRLEVPVVTQSGRRMSRTAGESVSRYLDDPAVEPTLRPFDGDWTAWRAEMVVPESLREFPARFAGMGHTNSQWRGTFPSWGDGASAWIVQNESSAHGLALRQLVRCAQPLAPGLAINLLGSQRGFHPKAASDGALAVLEAWERGLLRPGAADIRFLDWNATPAALAAFARVGRDLSEQGLLSVIWPLLDDLLAASEGARRMLAGTAEVAETVRALLPTVVQAVEVGAAPRSALDLPGVRGLAARGGSSGAVVAARAVAAVLGTMV